MFNQKEYIREYNKKHGKEKRKNLQLWLDSLKADIPCNDCGLIYPIYVMEWDHLKDKKFTISRITRKIVSRERILEEIKKCELVCANCHRIRSYKRRGLLKEN
jgi:hypothetical protein